MSVLISKEKTAITIDGKNIIYIRPRMTVGIQARLSDGLKLHKNGAGYALGIGEGEALMLLLDVTVIGWEGPDFEEDGQLLPCNSVTFGELPADYPLFLKVRDEVSAIYMDQAKQGTSPNSPPSRRTTRSSGKQ
jgi:hypothetical protein